MEREKEKLLLKSKLPWTMWYLVFHALIQYSILGIYEWKWKIRAKCSSTTKEESHIILCFLMANSNDGTYTDTAKTSSTMMYSPTRHYKEYILRRWENHTKKWLCHMCKIALWSKSESHFFLSIKKEDKETEVLFFSGNGQLRSICGPHNQRIIYK